MICLKLIDITLLHLQNDVFDTDRYDLIIAKMGDLYRQKPFYRR